MATIRRCLLALCLAMTLQIAAAIVNYFRSADLWGIDLFNNNHLGNMSVFAFFYIFALFVSSGKLAGRSLYFLLLIFIFGGIVASCSRTAWFTGFTGFLGFLTISRYFLKKNIGEFTFHIHVLPAVLVLVVLFFLALFQSDMVMGRMIGIRKLFEIDYWRFTFSDKQNFGFLGILRLEQYRLVRDILVHHWLVGVGFSKAVYDIHGLAFLLIASTGTTGLMIGLAFCVCHGVRLFRAIQNETSRELLLLLTGSLCSFFAWLLMSFMETFLVQFMIWANVLLGILLAELSKDLGAEKQNGRLKDGGRGGSEAKERRADWPREGLGTNDSGEGSICRNH